MARVLSVSIPEALYEKWRESDLDLSPSSMFQNALETELNKTNQFLKYWSDRALKAEKKLKIIADLLQAKDNEVKKFLLFDTEK
jgi:hypothetical protein